MAVGDIFLQTMNDEHPFGGVKEVLQNKDILFGNLETALSNSDKQSEKAVVLGTSPDKVKYLKDAGFDIINLANNHIMDLGAEGFHDTLEVLRKDRFTFIGANDGPTPSYYILERQGIRLGFLGYCNGGINLPEEKVWINRIELENIIKEIKVIKAQCDFVIVSLHWGTENVFYPSPKQIDFAHKLVDAGATVILGHHPHVIQGIEQYKGGLIAYSLGNFQFHYLDKEKTNESIIIYLIFDKERLVDYKIIPIAIDKDFVPRVANEKQKEILTFIDTISQPIRNGTVTGRWWFEQIAEEYLSGNMQSWIIKIRKYGMKYLFQCIRWLVSPFVIKCYLGIVRRMLKKI